MSSENSEKVMETLLTSLLAPHLTSTDVNGAWPLHVQEPKKISEAIAFYEERIRLLTIVSKQGFDTLAEHNEYKKAEDQIKKHKEKVALQQAEMECMDKSQSMSDEKVAERETETDKSQPMSDEKEDDMGFDSPGHTEIHIN